MIFKLAIEIGRRHFELFLMRFFIKAFDEMLKLGENGFEQTIYRTKCEKNPQKYIVFFSMTCFDT